MFDGQPFAHCAGTFRTDEQMAQFGFVGCAHCSKTGSVAVWANKGCSALTLNDSEIVDGHASLPPTDREPRKRDLDNGDDDKGHRKPDKHFVQPCSSSIQPENGVPKVEDQFLLAVVIVTTNYQGLIRYLFSERFSVGTQR
jgi:hypothetical protein